MSLFSGLFSAVGNLLGLGGSEQSQQPIVVQAPEQKTDYMPFIMIGAVLLVVLLMKK